MSTKVTNVTHRTQLCKIFKKKTSKLNFKVEDAAAAHMCYVFVFPRQLESNLVNAAWSILEKQAFLSYTPGAYVLVILHELESTLRVNQLLSHLENSFNKALVTSATYLFH